MNRKPSFGDRIIVKTNKICDVKGTSWEKIIKLI